VGDPNFKHVNVYGKWSGGPAKLLATSSDATWAWWLSAWDGA
jgi:hypothetical protein